MKLLFRIVKWLLIISLIVFALLQIDDNQSAESKAWIEEVQASNSKPSQAFYLQLGLMAPEGKDPIEFGKHRLAEAEKTYGNIAEHIEPESFPIQFNDPIKKESLGFSLPNDFCSLDQDNCINKVKNDSKSYYELLNSSQTLLKRYRKFLSLDDYREITSPSTTLYFGEYHQIISANKLLQIDFLLNSQNLEQDAFQLIADSRKNLAQSRTLLGKMAHHAIVQLNLSFYNQLLKEDLILGNILIPDVNEEEISLSSVIKNEYAIAVSQINLQHAATHRGISEYIKRPWLNVPYKKNMSINAHFKTMKAWYDFSSLTAEKQAKVSKITPPRFSFLEKYRNYGGWIMLSAKPIHAYTDYSKRLQNLQSKINLVNWYQSNKPNSRADINLKALSELNHFKTGGAFIDDKHGVLCLDVPVKHPHIRHHCISI